VHQQRHESHHYHHHGGQAIDQETDVRGVTTDLEPGVKIVVIDRCATSGDLVQHVERQTARDQQAKDGDAMRTDASDDLTKKTREQTADKRRQRDGQQNGCGKFHRLSPSCCRFRRC
jgi:capsid protein